MSARGLLRSMAIIGSAQVVKIVITIVQAKVVAVLLGPAGTGLLGVLRNFNELGVQTAGLGLASSGVRELSAAKGDAETLSRVRRVLLGALAVQGAVAMAAIWLARAQLSVWLLGSPDYGLQVGLVGAAVFVALISSSQGALLQGMRRIGDLGRVTVLGTLLGTSAGLVPVILLGQDGLIALVLVPPVVSVLVAGYYTRRLPPPTVGRMTPRDIWQAWRPMVTLGVVFMLGALVTTGTLLVVRARITQELGLDAAGQFAASWGITMVYVGFLLQAMGADYFPRLTEVIHDRAAAIRLVNDQTQLALALGGPVLLVLIGCAPWLIRLLYSAEFDPAVTLLQWQTLGNLIKIASWPRGFLFVAARQGRMFLWLQVQFNLVFAGLIVFGLPLMGLEIAGVGFVIAYVSTFCVSEFAARRLHGLRWERLSIRLFGLHLVLAVALLALSVHFPLAGSGASVILGLVTAVVGGHVVLTKIGPHGRLMSRLARIYERLGWPVKGGP